MPIKARNDEAYTSAFNESSQVDHEYNLYQSHIRGVFLLDDNEEMKDEGIPND